MKTLFYYSVALLSSLFLTFSCANSVSAFNYTVNFTASGASSSIDKVIVQNLTKGTTATISAGNTLSLTDDVNVVNQLTAYDESLLIFPNPLKENATISFNSKSSGNTQINILGIDGRKLAGIIKKTDAGENHFQLSLPKGAYAIQVTGIGFSNTAKVISHSNNSTQPNISFIGSNNTNPQQKSKSAASPMSYTAGDLLLFKASSGNYITMLSDIITASKIINFNFVECKDADGNYYPIVNIGAQVWMAENLKTTKYNDGTAIPNITDNSTWIGLKTAAYCWYNNDLTTYKNTYGAQYNWYAVNTNRLAPTGWHVASDAEWTTLTTYLGGESVAGSKLKETGTTHWLAPNTATNETGFTALPNGARSWMDGSYADLSWSYLWTSTPYDANFVITRVMSSTWINIGRGTQGRTITGCSVRCILGTPQILLPTITTTVASTIAQTTATSGGNISTDGGATVTARGICWSTTANPTTANSKTTDGTGTGSFTSSITGLTPGTTYYAIAYATNSVGTAYGNQVSFTTNNQNYLANPSFETWSGGAPTAWTLTPVVVGTVTQSATTSTGSGNSFQIANPTGTYTIQQNIVPPAGTSTFNTNITYKLSVSYLVKVGDGTDARIWSGLVSSAPGVIPLTYYAVPATHADSLLYYTPLHGPGGNIILSPGTYGNDQNGYLLDNRSSGTWHTYSYSFMFPAGIKQFNFAVRGYVGSTVIWDDFYFGEISKSLTPVISTTDASAITSSSALSGGNVTSDGGTSVIARGVCWSTSLNPTIANSKTADGTGTGSFSSNLTGLTANTIYHIRAYATNSIGTSYGSDLTFTTIANPVLPTITTTSASSIAQTTATSGGNVTTDGGASVTARGVCWSTTANPTTANSKTTDGTGTGSFASSLTGLTANTVYHIRAYATNSIGTSYGSDVSFTTIANPVLPTITTTAASIIAQTTATSGGNITADGGATVTARGVCWSTSANPTTANSKTSDGTGIGSFTSNLTGLIANTVYHIRAYATNSIGTAYGIDASFTTIANPVLPTITTTAVSNITQTTATSGGNVTTDGGASVTARGVCWSTSANPTTANSKTTDGTGTGSFTSSLTGLIANTVYHIRAYATNSIGTSYGSDATFTTLVNAASPTLTTTAASSIAQNSATSGGNITSDGGATVTARGVCWSSASGPLVTDSHTSDGTGIGFFTSSITGLTAGTLYYLRSYAINSAGTSYGNQISFTTNPAIISPTVTTTSVTNIAQTTATSGGNVTSEGSASVIAKGVCWSSSQNPTILNNKSTDGTGAGSYVSSITSLSAGTIYYVRAYATSSAGTSYGNQVSFTTISLPSLTTSTITSITQASATSGGNVTTDGGYSVTVKGICWNTVSGPTISNSKTNDGSGTGTFTSYLTGLMAGTTYYVRAYATNSQGTAYGSELSFSTLNVPTVTTTAILNIAQTTATSGGNVSTDGGATITARGICWSTSQNPTTANSKTFDGTGTGIFTSNITGLTAGTTYYVRAYATNSLGTTYGAQNSFTTITRPSVTTTAITNTTQMAATSGGNVTSDGGSTLTARGICWGITTAPTVAGNRTTDGNITGIFSSSISGLIPGTTYYVRAYATNSVGIAYGNELSFTTLKLPIDSAFIKCVGQVVASIQGKIITDGGFSVTTKGVCWSINQNPTISDQKTTDGTGIGAYISTMTGLTSGTTYYVRAYATNSQGTAYSNQVTIATTVPLTDFDGNNYKTVIIGSQEWMAENLKTTTYNDGIGISTVWSATSTTGAYCWYNNDYNTYGQTYGAYYNWYAVNTGKLCPSGWHVSSDAEWTNLSKIVGGDGGKLKETGTTHWASPNGGATNEAWFTALPGGIYSYYNSTFGGITETGLWWTSTQSGSSAYSYYRQINHDNTVITNSDFLKGYGLNIRCVKD